jgi:hypothetical protein
MRAARLIAILLVVLVGVVIGIYLYPETHACCYHTDFLSPNDFQQICHDFASRTHGMKSENLANVRRENLFVPRDSPTYHILEKYQEKLRRFLGNGRVHLAQSHPIEYRRYQAGSFMQRHRDVQLYQTPQYECILTLSNTTDSQTLFYFDENHPLRISPLPNSIMFVRANGVPHEVLPVTKGERSFIKFIMTETEDRM